MGECANNSMRDDSSSFQPTWLVKIRKKMPCLGVFPHCKLGEGFAPYAIGSDTGCVLVCPIEEETDVDEAALDLEKAKMSLRRDEPYSDQVLVFVVNEGRHIDKALYESREIHCFSEEQLVDFMIEYFSENREQIRLGVIAYDQGQYKMAASLLANADDVEDSDSQFVIAQMYAKGRGVGCDQKVAEEWYLKAAKQGHAGAALELEKMLEAEKAAARRMEDEFVAEVEEFVKKKLLAEGKDE